MLSDFIYDEQSHFICYKDYDLLQLMEFDKIDRLLGHHYAKFGIKYYFNDYKVGRFLGFVIWKELCEVIDFDCCSYMNCEYIDFDSNFPVDENILKFAKGSRRCICFCVLQHCLRYNQLPDQASLKRDIVIQLKRKDLVDVSV